MKQLFHLQDINRYMEIVRLVSSWAAHPIESKKCLLLPRDASVEYTNPK